MRSGSGWSRLLSGKASWMALQLSRRRGSGVPTFVTASPIPGPGGHMSGQEARCVGICM